MARTGQRIAATAKRLGLAEQTLHDSIKAQQRARLGGAGSKPANPERMEIARLRAELARVEMERDILG